MKVAVVADPQLHSRQQWSTILPSGRNSRLQIGVDCLEQSVSSLKEGDAVVIIGDVFEAKQAVATDVVFAFTEWLEGVISRNIDVVLMCGNHDHFTASGRIHSLRPFALSGHVTVVEKPEQMQLGKLTWCLHPFTEDIDAVRRYCEIVAPIGDSILCLHQAVQGGIMDGGILCEGGLRLEDIHPEHHQAVFIGHFHIPQQLAPNTFFVGSPYQVNRGEAGQDKRYFIIDDTDPTTFHQVLFDAPRFVSVTCEEFLAGVRDKTLLPRDFYTVVCQDEREVSRIRGITGYLYKHAPMNQRKMLPLPVGDGRPKPMLPEEAIGQWLTRKGRPELLERALTRYRETQEL